MPKVIEILGLVNDEIANNDVRDVPNDYHIVLDRSVIARAGINAAIVLGHVASYFSPITNKDQSALYLTTDGKTVLATFQTDLARETGLSTQQVKAALQRLDTLGFLTICHASPTGGYTLFRKHATFLQFPKQEKKKEPPLYVVH